MRDGRVRADGDPVAELEAKAIFVHDTVVLGQGKRKAVAARYNLQLADEGEAEDGLLLWQQISQLYRQCFRLLCLSLRHDRRVPRSHSVLVLLLGLLLVGNLGFDLPVTDHCLEAGEKGGGLERENERALMWALLARIGVRQLDIRVSC